MNSQPIAFPSHLTTHRLVLRKYAESDSEQLLSASIRNRNHLEEYEAENPILTINDIDDAESLIRSIAAEWDDGEHFFAGMFSRDSGMFLGQVYIGLVNKEVPEYNIGYIVDVEQEGKGYVTEAVQEVVDVLFLELNAHRISIECDDTNLRSIRVAERCGFVREGHIRENKKHPDGRISGTLFFGRLRTD